MAKPIVLTTYLELIFTENTKAGMKKRSHGNL